MRSNQETEHTEFPITLLLDELSNCDILEIGHDEESNKDEFSLSGFGTHNDPLYVTREELKEIGLAIVDIAEKECNHCDE